MKKLFITIALGIGLYSNANTNKYMINDEAVDGVFANSTEITLDEKINADMSLMTDGINYSTLAKGKEKKRGAFLALNFFLGAFGIHRYYMGVGDSHVKYWIWAFYYVVFFDSCVDFCWVLFKKEALEKYADNDALFVWLD